MDAAGALLEVQNRLVEQFAPLRIVLFGSHARGQAGGDSDLDLLVVVPNGADRRRETAAMYQALRGIPYPADLLVVTPQDIEAHGSEAGSVIEGALREGKVVFSRESEVA